jgi:RNA polymerase sigma-70 factor (ECF subfamily)
MNEVKLDNKAFDSIVEEHGKAIFNAAFRIVNDYEDAMDITQNTFIKVYERLDRYDPSHDIFSWLYKIAVNEAITVARRRSRTVELDDETCVQFRNPETEYMQNETSAHLQRALMELSLDYRTVLILRHFHGLSYEAIGAVLGIPEKTVKSRLFTGRTLLRNSLLAMGYAP